MPTATHRIMVVGLQAQNLRAPIVAWSIHGASDADSTMPGCDEAPPYRTVIDALRDGWRLLQYGRMPDPPPGAELRGGSLSCECVLEQEIAS